MILDATTKSIEVLLAAAPATNQLVVVADYYDDPTTGKGFSGEVDTLTNGTTAVTAVPAPATGNVRGVSAVSIFNNDTVLATVTVRLNTNGTFRVIMNVSIAPGETLHYLQTQGWFTTDVAGLLKTGGTIIRQAPLMMNLAKDLTNLTTVTAFATTVCHCYYMGVAPYLSTGVNLLANITTGVATITWAEIAIYTGTPTLNANCPNLTRLGWTSVAAIYNSTGRKNTAITLTTPSQPGDNLWVVMGCVATTPFQIRGGLADDIQMGVFQTLTARPSLTAGPTAGTLAGAAVVPGWVAIKCN